ncbi:oxidoreductase, 2OG-Fe(II) oxygenase family [Metarhizium album ARSEF 1941]|uniref:Oxidoreductase, 2OG-Fe(II) oxygenase family n=1 Tax=Metarhizium album (strain ARSEF 1941) TaxID=1081103 RepID=A0A0B2WLN0_METAS|nr:oxidoreductase, 2OG-Fe(II) oxygenase family [Metarhizium album ARSEF 1941]KHN94387.1 oxidoreductase, 2OG-Fe(II) oxygenase family [Metarhizium album ARSEF 1941]
MSSNNKMASLAVVDYEALANKDAGEIQRLVTACQTVGMFYLNLGSSNMSTVLEDVPAIFHTGHAFFNLPRNGEEKTQSAREGMERGYHAGKGFEYYEIPRDEYQGGKWLLPATFEPEKERITRTMDCFHRAIQTVIAELSAAVGISIPEISDDAAMPSDTALKLLYKPPMHEAGHVIHPWHTDFGLATLLWYDEVTTQIPVYDKEGKQTDDWETVPVVDGAVLVNIADELAARSGGRLHSTVHRVVAPPGPKRVRNGMIYLLRPYKA